MRVFFPWVITMPFSLLTYEINYAAWRISCGDEVFYDESVLFVNLTDVLIDDTHHSEFVALNKMQIESVVQID